MHIKGSGCYIWKTLDWYNFQGAQTKKKKVYLRVIMNTGLSIYKNIVSTWNSDTHISRKYYFELWKAVCINLQGMQLGNSEAFQQTGVIYDCKHCC